jgi:hypothetical protein
VRLATLLCAAANSFPHLGDEVLPRLLEPLQEKRYTAQELLDVLYEEFPEHLNDPVFLEEVQGVGPVESGITGVETLPVGQQGIAANSLIQAVPTDQLVDPPGQPGVQAGNLLLVLLPGVGENPGAQRAAAIEEEDDQPVRADTDRIGAVPPLVETTEREGQSDEGPSGLRGHQQHKPRVAVTGPAPRPWWALVFPLIVTAVAVAAAFTPGYQKIADAVDCVSMCRSNNTTCTPPRFGNYTAEPPGCVVRGLHHKQRPSASAGSAPVDSVPVHYPGAVSILVQLLADPSHAVKYAAAGTLMHLAGASVEHRQAIATAGAIPHLVQLLTDGAATTREVAATALMHLAGSSVEHRQAIAEAGANVEPGAIPQLVQQLKDGVQTTKESAAAALRKRRLTVREGICGCSAEEPGVPGGAPSAHRFCRSYPGAGSAAEGRLTVREGICGCCAEEPGVPGGAPSAHRFCRSYPGAGAAAKGRLTVREGVCGCSAEEPGVPRGAPSKYRSSWRDRGSVTTP